LTPSGEIFLATTGKIHYYPPLEKILLTPMAMAMANRLKNAGVKQ